MTDKFPSTRRTQDAMRFRDFRNSHSYGTRFSACRNIMGERHRRQPLRSCERTDSSLFGSSPAPVRVSEVLQFRFQYPDNWSRKRTRCRGLAMHQREFTRHPESPDQDHRIQAHAKFVALAAHARSASASARLSHLLSARAPRERLFGSDLTWISALPLVDLIKDRVEY